MNKKLSSLAVSTLLALLALASPSARAETCIAQDQSYSYEASAAGRGAAEVAALAVCRYESERPALCRLRRCVSGEAPRAKPPGGTRSPSRDQGLSGFEDYGDRVMPGAIRTIERGGKKCWGRPVPAHVKFSYFPYGRWPRSYENPYGRE